MSGSTVHIGSDGVTVNEVPTGTSITRNLGHPIVNIGADGVHDTDNILKKAPFDVTGYWVWSEGGIEWILWGDGEEIEL